jgi:hypothetical protein
LVHVFRLVRKIGGKHKVEANVDDEDRQNAERELMHLNGRMASLMDQIADLEAKDDLEPSEERFLQELKNQEEGIDREIRDVDDRL